MQERSKHVVVPSRYQWPADIMFKCGYSLSVNTSVLVWMRRNERTIRQGREQKKCTVLMQRKRIIKGKNFNLTREAHIANKMTIQNAVEEKHTFSLSLPLSLSLYQTHTYTRSHSRTNEYLILTCFVTAAAMTSP